jgi:hypothetical protein
MFLIFLLDTLYSSENNGCDESGDGSENKPFKTALKVCNV